jgi:epoxide hydrolase-like predicted phosphatase
MIKAILFDCFGVLYPDTFWTMAHEFLDDDMEIRRPELHDLVRQVDVGLITQEQLWQGFAEVAGSTIDDVKERLKEFDGIDKRLLRFIEEHKADYKIGMISNVGHGFVDSMFTEKSSDYYFDTLVLSSEVGLVKPDKKIYQLAAKNLCVDEHECIFIDDIERNAEGAKKAGMVGMHYTSYKKFIADIAELLK